MSTPRVRALPLTGGRLRTTPHVPSPPPASGARRWQPRRGQAMVEFGLIAVVFFLLVSGIFDFGLLLNGMVNLSSAASVGARRASVGAAIDTIASAAASNPAPGLSTARTVVVTYTAKVGGTSTTYCRRVAGGTMTDPGTVTVNGQTLTCTASGTIAAAPDDQVKVTVQAGFQFYTPLVRAACEAANSCPSTLNSSATMRYEGASI